MSNYRVTGFVDGGLLTIEGSSYYGVYYSGTNLAGNRDCNRLTMSCWDEDRWVLCEVETDEFDKLQETYKRDVEWGIR